MGFKNFFGAVVLSGAAALGGAGCDKAQLRACADKTIGLEEQVTKSDLDMNEYRAKIGKLCNFSRVAILKEINSLFLKPCDEVLFDQEGLRTDMDFVAELCGESYINDGPKDKFHSVLTDFGKRCIIPSSPTPSTVSPSTQGKKLDF